MSKFPLNEVRVQCNPKQTFKSLFFFSGKQQGPNVSTDTYRMMDRQHLVN